MYWLKLTIPSAQVTGGNKTNFPVLFNHQCSIPAEFWDEVLDADGLDIRFYNNTVKTIEYKRDIAYFDDGGQELISFIQVPTLYGSSDTVIYCVAGDGARANDTEVWDDINCKGMWHLIKDLNDATVNGNDGTETGTGSITFPAGKYGPAANFPGTNYSRVSHHSSLHCPTTLTILAWVKGEEFVAGSRSLMNKGDFLDRREFQFKGNKRAGPAYNEPQYLVSNTGLWNVNSKLFNYNGNLFDTPTAWHRLILVYEAAASGTDQLKSYQDGVELSISSLGQNHIVASLNDSGDPVSIGAGLNNDSMVDNLVGQLQGVSMINGILDDDWLTTEYDNQNDPITFIVCGDATPSLPVLFRRRKLNSSGF